MTSGERRQWAPRLRSIPLERVLPLCGGSPDRHDRHKWHTSTGTLSVTGVKFMNWTVGRGGGGAIDLVMQLHRLDFKGAVDWLASHFGTDLPPASDLAAGRASPRPQLRLPRPAQNQLARVRGYLLTQRRLPSPWVDGLIASGTPTPMPAPMPSFCCATRRTFPSAPNCAAPLHDLGAAWLPARKKTSVASPSQPDCGSRSRRPARR